MSRGNALGLGAAIVAIGFLLGLVLPVWLPPGQAQDGTVNLPNVPGKAVSKVPPASKPAASKVVRNYREENWVFDIVNGNVRFSHGNHKNRDRWFRAYFRKGYDCGICHNTSIPIDDGQGGVGLGEGEPLTTVKEIRDYTAEAYPYGVKMLTCLGNCHNGFTAPKECPWCHLPESKPILEGMKEVTKW